MWSITSMWIPPYPFLFFFFFVHFCFFWGNFDEACGVCLSGLSFRSGISKLSFDTCVVTAAISGAVNFDVDSLSLFFNAFFSTSGLFCFSWVGFLFFISFKSSVKVSKQSLGCSFCHASTPRLITEGMIGS